MLTESQKQIILAALDLEIASAKRGVNTSKRPEFTELYAKRVKEAEEVKTHIASIKPIEKK